MNIYILNFSFLLVVLNLLLYLKGFFRFDKAYKTFAIYLAVVFILLSLFKYSDFLNINKVIIIHTYIVLRFILLSVFYFQLIQNIFYKKILLFLLILFCTAIAVSFGLNNNLMFNFNLLESFFSSFFITLFSFYYAYQQIGRPKKFYYINIAIMVYSLGGSVFYIFSSLLNAVDHKLLESTENLSLIFGILSNLFISYEWYKYYSKRKLHE